MANSSSTVPGPKRNQLPARIVPRWKRISRRSSQNRKLHPKPTTLNHSMQQLLHLAHHHNASPMLEDRRRTRLNLFPLPLPIPPPSTLPNAFWRGLLFGSPDSLIGGADATNALRLVADRIGITIDQSETIPTLRAGELRKLLRERFGPAMAEQTFAALWRSAPPPPAPAPAPDQSQLPPGSWVDSQPQPRWARDLHDPDRAEQEWLSDLGVGSC
jgi:hypothetical protein